MSKVTLQPLATLIRLGYLLFMPKTKSIFDISIVQHVGFLVRLARMQRRYEGIIEPDVMEELGRWGIDTLKKIEEYEDKEIQF